MIGHKKEDNEDTEIPEHEVQGLNGWDEVEKQDLDEDDEEELVYLVSIFLILYMLMSFE